MSNYTQWRAAANKGEVKRVTWVCGDQDVLVNEVIDTTYALLGITDLTYRSLTAGIDSDRVIWATAHQYPPTPGTASLITVRAADRIKNWKPLSAWLDAYRQLTGIHLLFISNLPDFPNTPGPGKRPVPQPHIELIRDRGRIIRCSTPNAQDIITWVQSHSNLTKETANHLLMRVGGNLTIAATVLNKLALFDAQASNAAIDALVETIPAQTFTDLLLALDKPAALTTAPDLTDRDLLAAFTLLDSRLDTLKILWDAANTGTSLRNITGVSPFLARQYQQHARHYHPSRVAYDRRVLAVCDSVLRRGARVGVAETLVALW